MLITVHADPAERGPMLELIDDFRAFVLNENESHMMMSLSARPARLDEFEARLRPYGITEIQRTGRVALPALTKSEPAAAG